MGDLSAQRVCGLKEMVVGNVSARPGATVDVPIFGGVSCDITGFALAVGYDTSVLEFVDGFPGSFFTDYAQDQLFFQANSHADGYVIIATVLDITHPLTVLPTRVEQGTVLASLQYRIDPSAPEGVSALLNRTRVFGDPNPVSNVYSGTRGTPPIEPLLVDGTVNVLAVAAFLRGDANNDSVVDVSDVVSLLLHLFVGTTELSCQEAADFNNDSVLDVTDAIFFLNAFFGGGPGPPAPFPECGTDPGGLECRESLCNGN